MSDEPENLVLVHLRRIDQRQEPMEGLMIEMLSRLNDQGRMIAGLRRDQAGDAETVVHLQAQMDRLREQIDRINRRLDLAD
ncbi:hypothetical protein [Azospirillum sp. ST 5-10]|uniref:hypothetical protein n=1 Tax=unclassified Azospirillum TaxID=2630922 RepID=UPI003F4A7661